MLAPRRTAAVQGHDLAGTDSSTALCSNRECTVLWSNDADRLIGPAIIFLSMHAPHNADRASPFRSRFGDPALWCGCDWAPERRIR